MKRTDFGENFLWGVATAAAQNEGAVMADGRGNSIWDEFANKIGKIKGGDKPSLACDFYNKYKEDIALAKFLGFNTFRFSISWSRIFPSGTGLPNATGVQFYHKVIDECLQQNIEPMLVLYHWDLPLALQHQGGWANKFIQKWFEDYCKFCAKEYGHKVKYWLVLNEPFGFTALGYLIGKHAPGEVGMYSFFDATFNAAMAQAIGGHTIKANTQNAQVGTSFSCSKVYANTTNEADIAAASRADALLNRLFIEPALGLGFPSVNQFDFLEKLHIYCKAWKHTQQMAFNFDFIGLQNYFPVTIKNHSLVPYINAIEVNAPTRKKPYTQVGWEINANAFSEIIEQFWQYEQVKNIMITENGAAFKDVVKNAKINDSKRIDYFNNYLKALLHTKQKGVNITGYLAWTLTDNFEWTFGYWAKFGLVHTNFKTQQRTIKQSGYWWQQFLNG